MAVDGGLGDVAKQAARPVARAGKSKQLRIVVDEARRHLSLPKRLVADEPFEEIDVGGDSPDAELLERAAHAVDRTLARRCPRGDLLQQRIVVAGDDRARVRGAAIEADAEAGGGAVGGDPPVVGDEAVERVFRGDPALHRVTAQRDVALRRAGVVLAVPDGSAFGDADLGPHQVDAGHLLGDGVLHLDARVDLDEMEAPGVEIVQELHRARVEIVGRAGDGERIAGELVAPLRVDAGGRRTLHDLLVAPLHRAVALEEVDHLAARIGQHLDFEVAGPADETLEVDVVLAEGSVRLAPCGEQRSLERVLALDDAHAAPAAAPARLEHAGEAHRAAKSKRRGRVRRQRVRRRHRRHLGPGSDGPRGDLVAEEAQRLRPRADEGDPRSGTRFRELGRFGEEAVARMDGVALRLHRDANDVVHGQVGGDGAPPLADTVGLVGLEAVEGEVIFLRVDRDRGLAHLVGGAQDANGDLAPVRHQNSLEAAHRSAHPPVCRVRAFYTDAYSCGSR